MPLFEFKCNDCGQFSELLILGQNDNPECSACGSNRLEKQVSAHSSLSGTAGNVMPGLKDTACCGSVPGQASGCAGPGSCCGKNG